jgi:hypothetical protein
MTTRRSGILAALMAVVVCAVAGPMGLSAEGERIAVDLKAFKFKVRPEMADLVGYNDGEEKLFYYVAAAGEAAVKLPADGEYTISIWASCDAALNERAKFKVTLDGEPVGMEVLLTADDEKEYKLTASGKAGERKLAIEFTNDAYKENEYDRNLYVHRVVLQRAK